MARKVKRDENGKVKDSAVEKLKSWWLGRQIRKGKLPRGRTASEVVQAINNGLTGQMAEVWGILSAVVIHNNEEKDLGVVSCRKVTTAFRDYIVDSMQNSTTYPLHVFHYHGTGTNNAAEANDQTALNTEVETRANGNQGEAGANAYIYQTVATCNYTANRAIVEHGIFSANANGTLMDRSVFAAINVANGDSIQFTYQCTFAAEA